MCVFEVCMYVNIHTFQGQLLFHHINVRETGNEMKFMQNFERKVQSNMTLLGQ